MAIYCIGSAVLDLSASGMPHPAAWQEKQRIRGIAMRPGGDALNQSLCLAQAGEDVFLISAVGPDTNGPFLKTLLEDKCVRTDYLHVKENLSTGISLVLVQNNGERNTFSTGGAYGALTAADLPDPAAADAISVASLFQMPALEKEGLAGWLAEARAHGVPVFADLGSDKEGLGLEGIRHLLPLIDHFLPSRYDALAMTGAVIAEEAAAIYRSLGAHTVIIKCGADGAYCLPSPSSIPAAGRSKDSGWVPALPAAGRSKDSGWVPALPVTPVDTTGAGDCMVAAYIRQILAGADVFTACREACRIASLHTLQPKM